MKDVDPVFDIAILVDDNPIMNMVHGKIIGRTGVAKEIRPFTDPRKALGHLFGEINSQESTILVILDINMPEMGGFDFLDSVSLMPINGNALDIVMVTSSIDHADMQRGRGNALVSGYVTKPLMAAEIVNFVRDRSVLSV